MGNIAPYTVEQPFPGLYAIDEGGVRSFLIPGESDALLIDSGFGRGNLLAQVRELTDLPVTLLHTHTDGDHTGCNAQFDKILLHPAEYDYYAQKLQASDADVKAAFAKISPIWEGDRLCYGEYCLEVVLIPGHTPGSIALLDAHKRLLIGGDSVQTGAIFMFGAGRNMPAYLASMQKLDAMRKQFDTVLASHAQLCVDAQILPDLIEGAQAFLDGKLTGSAPSFAPGRPMPCLQYSYKRANFLC